VSGRVNFSRVAQFRGIVTCAATFTGGAKVTKACSLALSAGACRSLPFERIAFPPGILSAEAFPLIHRFAADRDRDVINAP